MRIKTFVGPDTEDAIKKLREEFGRDAVILGMRTVKRGKGTFGILGRSFVEITAGIDDAVPGAAALVEEEPEGDDLPGPNPAPWKGMNRLNAVAQSMELIQPIQDGLQEIKDMVEKVLHSRQGSGPPRSEEVGEVKALLRALIKDQKNLRVPQLPPRLMEWCERLIECGVDERLANKLIEEIHSKVPSDKLSDVPYLEGYIQKVLAHLIQSSGPIFLEGGRTKIVAIVGVTGVGKTTTVAKLAAEFSIHQKKKVAMITIDERKGAFEQVRFFSKAISAVSQIPIPAELVYEPNELRVLLNSFSGYDVIFLDTVGTPQFNEIQMKRLSEFLAVCPDTENYLVLSCPTRDRDLLDILRRFDQVRFDRIIFTKADECSSFGHIFNVLMYAKKPISYLTVGQRVPEDIEVASSDRLAELIIKGRR